MSADEILEKYALLWYLINDNGLRHLAKGHNYFDSTIFKNIIASKYPTAQQILEKYAEITEKYCSVFNELHNKEIERILIRDASTTKTKGSQRYLDLQNRLFTQNIKPNYVHSFFENKTQIMLMLNFIFKKIEKELIDKLKTKQVDMITAIKYKQFLEGHYSAENLNIAKKLFVEANEKLQFFKLSHKFGDNRHFLVKKLFTYFAKGSGLKNDFSEIKSAIIESGNTVYDFDSFSQSLEKGIAENKLDIPHSEILDKLNEEMPTVDENITPEAAESLQKINKELLNKLKFQMSGDGSLSIRKQDRQEMMASLKEAESALKSANPENFEKIKKYIEKVESLEDIDMTQIFENKPK